MTTLKRFCDAMAFMLMAATVSGFLVIYAFANGMEIRQPAGNMPKQETSYSSHDRSRLESKYRDLFNNM